MKSFHLPQLVLVCTCVVIELGVYPPKLACTPKLRSKGYMYPQFQNGVGMLMIILHEIYCDKMLSNLL